jgi:type II secretory pathway component PulJ
MRNLTRQSGKARRRPASRRLAFTLLEVVFALALSLLLFTAILSAVKMFGQISTVGREEVQQAQLSRAILRSMEIDIRSVIYHDPPDEEEEAEEELIEIVDAAEVFSGQSIGVYGDATTLVIHTGRPPRRLESLLPIEPSSDLKSIAYFLATPGGEGLQGATGTLLDTTGSGDVQGLVRLEGDRLAVEFADASGDVDALAQQATLLAEEVDFLQFRYFDGLTWLDAWDTSTYERLPAAIEITLGIDSQTTGNSIATEPRASRLYRFVVALPTAVPYLEEF